MVDRRSLLKLLGAFGVSTALLPTLPPIPEPETKPVEVTPNIDPVWNDSLWGAWLELDGAKYEIDNIMITKEVDPITIVVDPITIEEFDTERYVYPDHFKRVFFECETVAYPELFNLVKRSFQECRKMKMIMTLDDPFKSWETEVIATNMTMGNYRLQLRLEATSEVRIIEV